MVVKFIFKFISYRVTESLKKFTVLLTIIHYLQDFFEFFVSKTYAKNLLHTVKNSLFQEKIREKR